MSQSPDNFGSPQFPPPLAVSPVLDYRTPRPVETLPGSRARAVGKGIGLVWSLLALVVGMMFLSQGNGALVMGTLVLGGVVNITLAAFDYSKKRHVGLFIGLVIGVLTVIGVALLAVSILCGWWR
jgi:hypothetical protein